MIFLLIVSFLMLALPLLYMAYALFFLDKKQNTIRYALQLLKGLAICAVSIGVSLLLAIGLKTSDHIWFRVFLYAGYIESFFVAILLCMHKGKKDLLSVIIYAPFPVIGIITCNAAYAVLNANSSSYNVYSVLAPLVGVIGNLALMDIVVTKEKLSILTREVAEFERYESIKKYDKYNSNVPDEEKRVLKLWTQIGEFAKDRNKEAILSLIEKEKTASTRTSVDIFCADPYILSIIDSKKDECEKYSIGFTCVTEITRSVKLDPIVICSVIGNLLDNAIKACRQFGGDNPYIFISVALSGQYLAIGVKNSADKQSQKEDNSRKHYGKAIIESYVNDYQGHAEYKWSKTKKEYEAYVMLLEEDK